jgi:hypothetical protein
VDIVPHLERLAQGQDGSTTQRLGQTLYDIYQGEYFSSIIETMACFRACPGGCGQFVLCLKDAPNGCFCVNCFENELSKQRVLNEVLSANRSLVPLVTGARCGLGKAIADLFVQQGVNLYILFLIGFVYVVMIRFVQYLFKKMFCLFLSVVLKIIVTIICIFSSLLQLQRTAHVRNHALSHRAAQRLGRDDQTRFEGNTKYKKSCFVFLCFVFVKKRIVILGSDVRMCSKAAASTCSFCLLPKRFISLVMMNDLRIKLLLRKTLFTTGPTIWCDRTAGCGSKHSISIPTVKWPVPFLQMWLEMRVCLLVGSKE